MKGLDTNVLVRYFTQDDPSQSKAANALIEACLASNTPCFVNHIVLCELLWVLRGAYEYDKETASSVLDKMLSTSEFIIEEKDQVRQALEHYRAGQGDFSDYLLGLGNLQAGCEKTVTFDKSLKKSELFQIL